ncbi:MAG TPA: hypothetical protein VEU96_02115 [Bryobacteraceae bacterium]|nr:hypothetical protein [Bryobacteraceae bacterium]
MSLADAASVIAVTGLSSVSLVVLALLFRSAHKSGRRLRATVLGLTLLHEAVLVAYPAWYSAFTAFSLEAGSGVTADQLIRVYGGEAIFVLLFSFGLLMQRRTRSKDKTAETKETPVEKALLVFLLVGAGTTYVAKLFEPNLTYRDLERHWEIVVRSGFWEMVWNWTSTLFQWPGLIAAALAVSIQSLRWYWRAAAWTTLLAQLIYAMLYGLRGGIVYVVLSICACGYYAHRKRAIAVCVLLSTVLVPLFPWLHSTMRYTSFGAPTGTSRIELVPEMFRMTLAAVMGGETSAQSGGFALSWAQRAEGPRNSATMYELYDAGGPALYKPILGAIVLPIPRALWLTKPAAGSTDSTNLGAAIYRVQQKRTAYYDMGPVLASAHAYWEGGWTWLVIAGVASGYMWNRLLLWAERTSSRWLDIIVLTMVTALPVDGFFSALNPVFAYLRVFWITIIPLWIIARVFHRLLHKRAAIPGLRLVMYQTAWTEQRKASSGRILK